MIHPQTAFVVVGFLFVAMPLTAWTILHGRHDRQTVGLWCTGGLLYGIGFILVGVREAVPAWLTFPVANALAFAGYPLRLAALRREAGETVPGRALLLVWAGASAAYLAIYLGTEQQAPRLAFTGAFHLAGAALLSAAAWQVRRTRGYRSAAMVAAAFAVFAAALAGRLLAVGLDWGGATAMPRSLDFALAFVAAIVAALYGNLGFIGIALEAARRAELDRAREVAREHEQRRQSELRAQEEGRHLAERERLLAAREELLATMAYEVRQPLTNAAAALQAASQLVTGGDARFSQVAAPIRQANSVLSEVAASLNNTLADAVLLEGSRGTVERDDVDVDLLLQLAFGDIDPLQRERIQCRRSTRTRTASMNLPLVRLALRNVIDNALRYSPPGSAVVVELTDCDEPLALVVSVSDAGPGIPAHVMGRLFERGVLGTADPARPRLGLGLYIAQRVMQMHGGQVRVESGQPVGQTVSLLIAQ